MQALTIIKHGQVVNHAQRSVSPCFWWLVREAFFFQTPKHPFHHRIIITIALPTHAALSSQRTGAGVDTRHWHTDCPDPSDAASPGAGWRCPTAIWKALVIKRVAIDAAQAHPTTLRENRSTTIAIYSHPSWVQSAVISLPHTRLGAVTANWRLSTLGARGRGMPTVRGVRTAARALWFQVRLAHQHPCPMATHVTPGLL